MKDFEDIKVKVKKKKTLDPNVCPRCGGKRGGFADDYFIRKCWCLEMEEEERHYSERDDFEN